MAQKLHRSQLPVDHCSSYCAVLLTLSLALVVSAAPLNRECNRDVVNNLLQWTLLEAFPTDPSQALTTEVHILYHKTSILSVC